MPFPRIYNPSPSSGGGGSGENIITQLFNFAEGPSKLLFTLLNTYRILTCQIIIETVFDDAATLLTVGDITTPARFMKADQNIPTELGEYEANPYAALIADTGFYVYISPGASTQGNGVVVIEYDQP